MNNELLDDYTKATFPLELEWGGAGKVRLLAAFGDKVVGASYWSQENPDGTVTETLSQVLDWDGRGMFAEGAHPSMDLPPPPAIVGDRIAELRDKIASIRERLDAHPDAPTEWRSRDEEEVRFLERKIAELEGKVA